MRFWVWVFSFLLPMQFSAAVWAGHCPHGLQPRASALAQHEPARAAASLGSARSETSAMAQALGVASDCGTCHAGCAGVPATALLLPQPKALREVMRARQTLAMDGPCADPPERPQWNAPVRPGSAPGA